MAVALAAPARPASSGWSRPRRVPLLAALSMLPLYVVWALFRANGGGDLAAQEAWARFAADHGDSAYGLFWFGGLHTANYSLISPYLMGYFGVRTVAVVSGMAASWLAAELFVRSGMRRPLAPALVAAFGLWVNVAAGRVTFALGVAFALAACVVLVGGRRPVPAAGFAVLATAGSPVAGLFLVVAGAAYGLVREWWRAVALAVPPFLVVGVTTLLFPFDGEEPMASGRVWWPMGLGLAVAVWAPRGWRVVRFGGAVYAAGVGLSYLLATPIGSNVERLALLFAPAVLLAALVSTAPGARLRRGGLALALAGSLFWMGSGTPVSFVEGSSRVPAWAADTKGLLQALDRFDAGRGRVEVVPAQDHREAAVLAPHVNLARGWNTQLDVERGRIFYDGTLTPAAYRTWLDRWAVGFVAVPDAVPDHSGAAEAQLIRRRPDWLEPVWGDAHWTLYRVRDAVPLVSAPGEVVRAPEEDAYLVVYLPKAGSVTVRLAYSPWLRADNGACLRGDGEFTRLTARAPGIFQISSQYDPTVSLPQAGHRQGC
ncbi:glycosyltransferase family 87 protein [Streptomyces niveiscabiei]|uniref:glycosyltransferase family 87 protein n=1 Tax=Streptomyces niveiscabiei TaxID=164115 RepID=UPI0029A37EBD|nr:glycosyltransferase family 87 protein [Streptomyces niveiscabiei]MDX3383274.1 glycosyltransferase family 87 protein [Streptomyces niveiscabiei]